MAVSLSTSASLVIAELNAALSYGSTVTDPRFYTAQITDAVLSADGAIVEAICRNINHPRRSNYYTTQSNMLHGDTLGNSAGPPDTVMFVVTGGTAPGKRAAIEWDKEEIQNEIAIYGPSGVITNPFIDPHFALDGNVLYHNGTVIAFNSGGGSASINVTYPTYARTSACQAPDEFTLAVVCGALGLLFPVEGENSGVGGFYYQQFVGYLQAIATNGAMPQMKSYQAAA